MAKPRSKTPRIPRTIDEAVDHLLVGFPAQDAVDFARTTADECIIGPYQFGGMGIRNAWGLWHGKTVLSKRIRAAGILHGDDASAVIFKALWCRLNRRPFDLATEAAHYRAYWAEHGLNPDGSPINP